jgi:hypothetical protein
MVPGFGFPDRPPPHRVRRAETVGSVGLRTDPRAMSRYPLQMNHGLQRILSTSNDRLRGTGEAA